MKKFLALLLAVTLFTGCTATKDKSAHAIFTNKKGEQKYLAAYDATLKLWPVKFEQKDITTAYGTAHVLIAGPAKGEPLVLFHGMDASSTMWYPNIRALSKNYRVYAIDYILEAGKSKLTGKRPNNDEVTKWYNEVFDALKLDRVNIMGTSRGGWLATNYTVHNPGRVKKLLLLSPVQTFGLMDMNPKLRKAINFKFFPNRKRLNKLVDSFTYYPDKVGPAFKEQLYLGTKYSRTSFDMLEMAPFSDKELKSLTMPVLILVGDHDILCGPDVLKKAGAILPDTNTGIIKDAGHFLTIDQQDVIDKKVVDFLSGKSGQTGNTH